jgi:hypothetical protein
VPRTHGSAQIMGKAEDMEFAAATTRTTLRWLGLVGVAVVLGACGTTTPTSSGPDGTPAPETLPDAADMGPAASGATGNGAQASAAPDRRGPVEAGEPGLMPGGDGSALLVVPTALDLPPDWSPVPPDGPHFRTEVCGVQLDPATPVDAAQRRWAYLDAEYLESEVHLFADDQGRRAAEDAAAAVTGCQGYGVAEDGTETELGRGELDVTVQQVAGAPDGWTVWTETTSATGMVRHIALAPVRGGWHWMSHADLLGAAGPELLLDALPETDAED